MHVTLFQLGTFLQVPCVLCGNRCGSALARWPAAPGGLGVALASVGDLRQLGDVGAHRRRIRDVGQRPHPGLRLGDQGGDLWKSCGLSWNTGMIRR